MTGRLGNVLAELGLLGAVVRRDPPSVKAPAPAPESPAVDPPTLAEADSVVLDIPGADLDVEEKIRALTDGFPVSLPEEEPLDDDDPSEHQAVEDHMEPTASVEPAPANPSLKVASRRLREAFARLDLLEANVADLRDSLQSAATALLENE